MNYDSQDILKMQQDAVARVREMQERARKNLSQDTVEVLPSSPASNHPQSTFSQPDFNRSQSSSSQPDFNRSQSSSSQPDFNRSEPIIPSQPAFNSPQPIPPPPPPMQGPERKDKNLFNLFGLTNGKKLTEIFDFKSLLKDKDNLIIVFILLLLADEGADEILILALVYILL